MKLYLFYEMLSPPVIQKGRIRIGRFVFWLSISTILLVLDYALLLLFWLNDGGLLCKSSHAYFVWVCVFCGVRISSSFAKLEAIKLDAKSIQYLCQGYRIFPKDESSTHGFHEVCDPNSELIYNSGRFKIIPEHLNENQQHFISPKSNLSVILECSSEETADAADEKSSRGTDGPQPVYFSHGPGPAYLPIGLWALVYGRTKKGRPGFGVGSSPVGV